MVTWRCHLAGANAIRVSYSNGLLSDWLLVKTLPELKSDWPLKPLKNGQDTRLWAFPSGDSFCLSQKRGRCQGPLCFPPPGVSS